MKTLLVFLAVIESAIAYTCVYAKESKIDDCNEFVIVYNRYADKEEKLMTYDTKGQIPNIPLERVKLTHNAGTTIQGEDGKIGLITVADCDLSNVVIDKSVKKVLVSTRTTDVFYLPTEIKGCYAYYDMTGKERTMGYYQLDFVKCQAIQQ